MDRCFAKADKNGDGKLSVDELHELAITVGAEMDKARFGWLVAKYDRNGDGHLDKAEFCQLLFWYQRHRERRRGSVGSGASPGSAGGGGWEAEGGHWEGGERDWAVQGMAGLGAAWYGRHGYHGTTHDDDAYDRQHYHHDVHIHARQGLKKGHAWEEDEKDWSHATSKPAADADGFVHPLAASLESDGHDWLRYESALGGVMSGTRRQL